MKDSWRYRQKNVQGETHQKLAPLGFLVTSYPEKNHLFSQKQNVNIKKTNFLTVYVYNIWVISQGTVSVH